MKKEVYLKFKDYEQKLNTALHSNFVRFTTRELNAFNDIIKEHRGQGLTPSQRTCPHCLLSEVKKIAEEYFKFRESPWGKKLERELNGEHEEEGNSQTAGDGEDC